MKPIMNDTKWEELRLAMYELDPSPRWRTRDVENGYVSDWDGEWFYHFREGGYATIEWLEIRSQDDGHHDEIRTALKRIHVPGEERDESFMVLGYARPETTVVWI